ncbi:hypothetical protein LXL04_003007 [Taraxacum kok-saghyz]
MEGDGEVIREKTRIYVGGLGGAVTEDDLRKTFSALGEVVSVDVVRTKDRSFAYLDFLPSSDKSLPKLFSTYNGCMWKGGKLRLEKAKEHYLEKMRREWQEESKLASKPVPSDSLETDDNALKKPTKPSSEINKQLCLFFPKLGKVKSLGQVGIGKHKYSFQRIQVPPIPTHFCDCEEHSIDFPPPDKNKVSEIEKPCDGVNEQEVNIMNSVMNKIFERANPSKKVDEDNLIINVGNGSDGMDLVGEMKSMMANQMHDDKKRKSMKANKVSVNNRKSEVVVNDESTANEDDDKDNLIINVANKSDSADLLAEMRMMVNKEKKATTPVKKRKLPNSKEKAMVPEPSRKARKIQVESDTKQPSGNSLRSLKSTWKDLIGRKRNNTSINISEILRTAHQEKQTESNPRDNQNDVKTNESSDSESDHKENQTEGSHAGSLRKKSSWTQLILSDMHSEVTLETHLLWLQDPCKIEKKNYHFGVAMDVKSLGQIGIWKHKYSFQRIQVPPIPTHFCDCEEHSTHFPPPNKNKVSQIEKPCDGVNEQEVNIMNSVMNKIFERANPSKKIVDTSIEEDKLTDEDNLIINVGNGSDGMDLVGEMRTMMANQDAVAKIHKGQ